MASTLKTSTASVINKARAKAAPADLLMAGGRAAATAGEQVKIANDGRATALDMLIAGLTPSMLELPIAFDVCDRAGNVTESAKASLVAYAKGFKNNDGSDNRTMQSAFRSVVLPSLFGVPGDQSAGAKAAWALVTGKAIPTAIALMLQDVTAKLNEDGALALDGGVGAEAEALKAAAAKSTSALVKAAKGETGTTRDAPQNDKAGDTRAATPGEIAIAAFGIAKRVAKGEEAISNSVLSTFRELAKLIAANPDAFAED